MAGSDAHSHEHGHPHDHSHLDETAVRVRALESLLVAKGYVDPAALNVIIDECENNIGPRNGAKVVARAWTDANYRQWLLEDGSAAIADLGFAGRQGEHMVVVANTPSVHNLIVCTLCSCYPWPVLGLPPTWYKSAPYRSRAVIEPESVLAEFGVELAADCQVTVWDSTAEIRYLVLPMQPANSSHLSEDELAQLVTRDSMIGTGLPLTPEALAASPATAQGQAGGER